MASSLSDCVSTLLDCPSAEVAFGSEKQDVPSRNFRPISGTFTPGKCHVYVTNAATKFNRAIFPGDTALAAATAAVEALSNKEEEKAAPKKKTAKKKAAPKK